MEDDDTLALKPSTNFEVIPNDDYHNNIIHQQRLKSNERTEDHSDSDVGEKQQVYDLDLLDLSYSTWRKIPVEILQFQHQIRYLDLSYNSITKLLNSSQHYEEDTLNTSYANDGMAYGHKYSSSSILNPIASLILLEKLNLSHNQLDRIEEDTLGKCIRLTDLNISHNKLIYLPKSLSNCTMLRKIWCQNNKIQYIPKEFGKELKVLNLLDLRCNDLHDIPSNLSLIPTLKEICCQGGNEKLSFSHRIPKSIIQQSSNNNLLMDFCIRQIHYVQEQEILKMTNQIRHLEKRVDCHMQSNLRREEFIRELKGSISSIQNDIFMRKKKKNSILFRRLKVYVMKHVDKVRNNSRWMETHKMQVKTWISTHIGNKKGKVYDTTS